MKSFLLTCFLLILVGAVHSQIEITTPYDGTQSWEKVAPENINFKPDFSYVPEGENYFHAYIDPNVILPVTYLETPIDPDNRPLDMNLPVGTTPGQASVSLTGGATYTIPLFCAPGTAGMQPSLSLVYNSQSGNGIAGYGWNLAGLSAITRVGHTIYHDGAVKGVDFDDDRFALDGQRLIMIDNTSEYGADGVGYYTEMFNGSKIISHGSTGQGPEWFEVIGKDGSITEYGKTDNSRLTSQRSDQSTISWFINKITDPNGNYMVFLYDKHPIEVLLREIKYTGNDNVQDLKSPYNSIKIFYAERTDKSSGFIAGSRIDNKFLIDHINIFSENKLVKKYQLKYFFDFYSKLNEVVEYDNAGEHYNSTVFGYFKEEDDDIFKSSNVNGNNPIYGDIDGDGLTDILVFALDQYHSNDWCIHLNKGGGFNSIPDYRGNLIDTRTYQAVLCDINGDGLSDFLLNSNWRDNPLSGEDWHYEVELFLNNGNGFDHFDLLNENTLGNNNVYDKITSSIYVSDIDGDKKDEIVFRETLVFMNETTEYFSCLKPTINNGTVNVGLIHKKVYDEFFGDVIKGFYTLDLNGDGKDELIFVKDNKNTDIWALNFSSNGSSTLDFISSSSFPLSKHEIFPGDYNGDGKVDLLTKYDDDSGQKHWTLAYWLVNSFVEYDVTDSGLGNRAGYDVGDFNGDGKSDIVSFYFTDCGLSGLLWYQIFLSTNNAFMVQAACSTACVSTWSWLFNRSYFHRIVDFNGDGIGDISLNLWSGNPIQLVIRHPWENKKRISTIANGLGYKAMFMYSTFATKDNSLFTTYKKYDYPLRNMGINQQVVKNLFLDDGMSGYNSTSYRYSLPTIHLQGRGMLGFETIESSTSTTVVSSYSKNSLNQDFYFLQPEESYQFKYDNNWNRVKLSSSEYEPKVLLGFEPTNKVFLPWQQKVTERDFANLSKKVTEQEIDSYGNPLTTSISFFDNNLSQPDATSLIEYQDYWSAPGNIPSKPGTITTTVARDNRPAITSSKKFIYDTKGNIVSIADFYGLPKAVTTTYSNFSNVGIPLQTTVSAPGMQSRVSNAAYDNKFRFLTTLTDAEGYTSVATYDPAFGNKLSSTTANEQTTSFEYDGFGMPVKQTDHFGVWDKTETKWYGGPTKPNVLYYIENTSNNGLASTRYFDKLGRELYSSKTDPNGQVSTVMTTYNSKGQVTSLSEPYFEGSTPTQFTTTTYHPDYGFVQTVSLPTGAVLTYTQPTPESPGRTSSVSNSATQTTTSKTIDCTGKTIAANDPGGTISYTYYSDGQTKDITNADGKTVTITYNDYGQQESLTDPDAGVTTYGYDAFGQLIHQLDANGNSTVMKYDKNGRMYEKEINDGQSASDLLVTFHPAWAPKGSRGAIDYRQYDDEAGNSTRETYQYSLNGLLTQKTITTDNNNKSFTYLYTYDAKGNPDEYTYPSGYTIKNEYNAGNGALKKVIEKQSGKILYAPGSYNARGQIDHYAIANQSIYTSMDYDVYGMPAYIKTGHAYPGSSDIQNLETQFDPATGNLNFRRDNNLLVNGQALTETFTYDQVHGDRLASWQVTNQPSYSISYADNNGNILNKSDITSTGNPYQYTDPAHAHAVTSIVAPLQLPASALQRIAYNHFNSVKSIEHPSEGKKLLLLYGVDGQRIKTEYYSQNTVLTRTKYFINGDYEEVGDPANGTVRRIHYLPGGGMYVLDQNNQGVLYYILTDYQGTWHKVITETGAAVEQYSFDPWGRRRNPADWSYNIVPTAYQFDRGYTGHEMLDAFGLINMNGRVYDPLMARFLSPDNYVQLPGNTQGFNRYSYCLNNPLKYTDPSGEFIPLVYAAVAMYIAMQGVIQGDLAYSRGGSFWEGFALGSITACISMSIGPIIGPLVQGPGALASAANAAANAAIAGGITYGINSLVTGETFDWKGWGINVAMAALLRGVDGGITAINSKSEFSVTELPSDDCYQNTMTDGELKEVAKKNANVAEGQNGIQSIDQKRPSGYNPHPKNNLAWNNPNGERPNSYVLGVTTYSFWGKIRIHIAPYATLDETLLTGVIIHEGTHAWHYYMGYSQIFSNKDFNMYSENAAYKAQIYYYNSVKAPKTYIDMFKDTEANYPKSNSRFWAPFLGL